MATPELRVRLLGEFDLRADARAVAPLESARARSLLAYLLLHRDAPQPRQRLAFLLWPDSTEPQARTNLRHQLHNLRKSIPGIDDYLAVTPQTLQWRADAPLWLDVAEFEQALARAHDDNPEAAAAALRHAVGLYAGDLVPDGYDEWLDAERARLRGSYMAALEQLGAILERQGDYEEAIGYANRLLRGDALHEGAYRQLMRLYDARGDRARALRVYHACAAALERELNVVPSAATRAAYESLLPRAPAQASQPKHAERPSSSPLIGRARAWTRLTELWRASERGHAHLLLLTGEAGIGKTRLLEELRSWCGQRGVATAEARSYAAEGALAFGSIAQWLRSDALSPRLARLEPVHLAELARLLPELSATAPGVAAAPAPADGEQRHRLFGALARAILSHGGPLLLVADDLHWCDTESLQCLHFLLRSEPRAPLLVAGAARREDLHEPSALRELIAALHALERITEIELARLNRVETAELAARLTSAALVETDAQALFRETEGNPLFVVEAVRAGWKPDGSVSLSPRVQASIESRLGQLSPAARELLGLAATMGREFTTDVISRASDADESTLVRALDELWRSRIVRERDSAAYDFSHDKIRQVAYQALSPVRRRQHHLRIAAVLKQLHAQHSRQVSGQIAAHYDRAGVAEEAIGWYERAADHALQLHAHTEALRLLTRAQDLMQSLPGGAERQARELALLNALVTPISVVEGWASARLQDVHSRGLELSSLLAVEPAPHLLRSLAIQSFARDDFAAAQGYGRQLYERARSDRDDMLFVESDYVQGIAWFWQGALRAAQQHFQSAIDRYRPAGRPAHLQRFGLDPQVICMSRLGNTLWLMGDGAAAQRARDTALALAHEIGHAPTRAVALVFAAFLALETNALNELDALVSALEARNDEHDAPQIRLAAQSMRFYLEVVNGNHDPNLSGLADMLEHPHTVGHAPGMRAAQARVFLAASEAAGDARMGMKAVAHALHSVGAARLWDAEAHRVHAECLAVLGAAAHDVEASFERALEVARQQGARMLERKAASSLLRHKTQCGDARGAAAAQRILSRLEATIPA
jgi:DNA-binding SARP family transcriptional activator